MSDPKMLLVQETDKPIGVGSCEHLLSAIADKCTAERQRVSRLYTAAGNIFLILKEPSERFYFHTANSALQVEFMLLLNEQFPQVVGWHSDEGTCDINSSKIVEYERQQRLVKEQYNLALAMERQSRAMKKQNWWMLGFTVVLLILTVIQVLLALWKR